MKAYGVTTSDIAQVTELVSANSYEGNLITNRLENGPGNAVTFTLRVRSSRGKGHRFSTSGRRMVSACWHAHRDVMIVLFNQHPDMKLVSALATYNGRSEFMREFPDTYYKQVGSVYDPVEFGSLCSCDGSMPVRHPSVSNACEPSISANSVDYSVSYDAQRWNPGEAEKAIDDWNNFVAEIKARTNKRKVVR